jgi:hypothetical protein
MKKLIVLTIALAVVGIFTAQAIAETSLYGSARMWTYRDMKEGAESAPGAGDGTDDDDTLWNLGPFSRFGATFKGDGAVSGKFEMDARDANGDGASHVGEMRLRHLYGVYDWGSGQMLVGQTWPVIDQLISGLQRTGGGLQPYGGLGHELARVPQIRFTWGNLRLSLASPYVPGTHFTGAAPTPGYTDVDTTLPTIEADYKFNLGDVGSLTLVGGYKAYDLEDNAADDSEGITSYVLAVKGKFNFGPAYLNAIFKYAINPDNYGTWNGTGINGTVQWEGGSLQDYTLMGGALVLGMKFNDMVGAEIGYGMNTGESDTSATYEQGNSAYYLAVPITIADGVKIVPEIAMLDYGDTETDSGDTDNGEMMSIGAVWYISF